MDATGAALVQAVEPYGLMPLLAIGAGIAVVAVLCAFVFPAWRKNLEAQQEIERMKAEAQIKIEGERESRKAKEAEDAAENQRKRAEIDGKTALLLEGLKASIDTLVADQERVSTQFEASRNNSQRMGATVEDTNKTAKDTNSAVRETRHMVEDIHRALIS